MTQDDGTTQTRGGSTRRLLLIGLALVLVAGAVFWWRSSARAPAGPDASAPLVVGDQRGGIQALLKAAGELDNVPYTIDWALFPAASPLLEALGSGAIDLGGVGGAPFAFAYASGAPIKVVFATRAVTGFGGRSSAIIVRRDSPFRSLADLRGKSIATVRGSAGQNLALRLLEQQGIGFDEVKWIYLNNGEAKAALAAGSIDSWSTWGSYVGVALLEDHDRALADATALPAEAGFYAANDKAIANKRTQLADFLQRAARARRWALGHRDDYARVLAKETGIPFEVARLTVEGYLQRPITVDDSLRAEQRAILDRYRRAGVIPSAPDLAGAFDPSFNAAVAAGGSAAQPAVGPPVTK
jgi:sulfonate transport system substrate-binding protein